MKKGLFPVLVMLLLLLIASVGLCEDAEWTCRNCGTVNTGNFCVKCGEPLVTPTPVPTAEPTPVPTEEPETWVCRYCRGTNNSENAFCRYCGTAKPDPKKEHVDNPVAELYKGMTMEDVIEACGGKEIKKLKYSYLELFVDYNFDSYDRLESVELKVNSSYIKPDLFVYMMKKDFGKLGWTSPQTFYGVTMLSKEYDDLKLSLMIFALKDMYMNVLRIEPLVNWDNVKTGRETVQKLKDGQ